MDNQNNQNRNNNQDPDRNNRQGVSFVLIVTLITTILVLVLFQFQGVNSAEEISYIRYIKLVEDGEVEKVVIGASQINITAKQGKDTALNNANKYRNEQIPQAEAEADKILQDAEAEKESRINEAEGQVARFNSMYEEYVKYPAITRQRMFYEAMEDVLPDMKVIIEGGNGSQVQQLLPLEPFSSMESTNSGETEAVENGQ